MAGLNLTVWISPHGLRLASLVFLSCFLNFYNTFHYKRKFRKRRKKYPWGFTPEASMVTSLCTVFWCFPPPLNMCVCLFSYTCAELLCINYIFCLFDSVISICMLLHGVPWASQVASVGKDNVCNAEWLRPVWLFCDPMDCSPPGSSVYGISQAKILEWVAISFSRGSFQPRDWTCISCTGRWILYHWVTREAHWSLHPPCNKGKEIHIYIFWVYLFILSCIILRGVSKRGLCLNSSKY